MLSKLRVQHYKSLFDTEVDLEPLTVFIGPNGSGKSNICEALAVLSNFLQKLIDIKQQNQTVMPFFAESLNTISKNQQNIELKFWQGKQDYILFEVTHFTQTEITPSEKSKNILDLSIYLDYHQQVIYIKNLEKTKSVSSQFTNELRSFLVTNEYLDSLLENALRKVSIYDFVPTDISSKASVNVGRLSVHI